MKKPKVKHVHLDELTDDLRARAFAVNAIGDAVARHTAGMGFTGFLLVLTAPTADGKLGVHTATNFSNEEAAEHADNLGLRFRALVREQHAADKPN